MAVTSGKHGVGIALRELRRAAGMTLADVSTSAGISAPYLSNVENGNVEPSAPWVQMVLAAIGDRIAESRQVA